MVCYNANVLISMFKKLSLNTENTEYYLLTPTHQEEQ